VKPSLRLAAMVVLVLLVPRSGASEMRDALHVDASNPRLLRTRFGTYGYQPRRSIFPEAASVRFWLPDADGVPQTGLYSYFVLAGDCEVTLTYELLNLPPPRGGYGSGVGLAFDFAGGGRGAIQRVARKGEGDGYVLQTTPGEFGGKMKEVDQFVPTVSTHGRIGLRRVKNKLIFLRADAVEDPLTEFESLPFTDRPIRAVRLFADPGGSPTALDVTLSQIEIRAEEIASGVPRSEQNTGGWRWLWAVVFAAVGALGFWMWRTHRRKG